MTRYTYEKEITALLVIDPYNDFISEGGKIWDRLKGVAVGSSYDVGRCRGWTCIRQSGALSACADLGSEIWARCAKPRPKEIFSPGVS